MTVAGTNPSRVTAIANSSDLPFAIGDFDLVDGRDAVVEDPEMTVEAEATGTQA